MQKFAVVIHESLEGGFRSEVPALPGCYPQGGTIDQLSRSQCTNSSSCNIPVLG